MRYLSLFSGIEAASVAWAPLGWEPVAFSENDAFPSAVLGTHYPDVPNLGDIRTIGWKENGYDRKDIGIIVGGSPCQSFSTAGKRAGLQGASGLMLEYIRAVQEVRPRWLIWENVPGALSTEHGKAFGQLLRELDGFGYDLAWRILDAQFFRVAQRRRRLFLVGHLGGGSAGEVLFEPEGMQGDPQSREEARKTIAARSGKDIDGPGCFLPNNGSKAAGLGYRRGLSPTLKVDHNPAILDTASTSFYTFAGQNSSGAGLSLDRFAAPSLTCTKVSSVMSGGVVRNLTPLECERLQGFPDGWTDIPYKGRDHAPDSPRYKAIGNSMAVPVMRWLGRRIQEVDDAQR